MCPSYHDIVQNLVWVQVKSIGNRSDPLRSEGVLCINEHNFALTTTLRARQLGSDAKRVAHLRLAGSEFPKRFCNSHTFHPTLQQCIKTVTSRRDPSDPFSFLEDLHSSLELH